MDFPKKQQQCLIPRYLLQYLTSLEYHHLDPTAEWGGSGSTYTAGDGITISDEDVISIDNTVALKTDLLNYVTSSELVTELSNYVTTTDLATELLNYAELDDIPTKTSDLTNNSGFITSSALTGYATETWVTNQGYITSTDLAAELLNYAELSDLAAVAITGDYNDLINKPTIPVVPTNISAFTNDSGYITSSALTGYATENWVTNQGYLTSVSWNDILSKPTFATVATSGSYNDLTDKPSIPDAVSGTNDGTNWTSLTIGSDTYGLASGSTPANIVTTDTAQDINGIKTFVGNTLAFKNDTNNVSGFKIYNQNNTEIGSLKVAPTSLIPSILLSNASSGLVKSYIGFNIQPNGSSNNYKFVMPYAYNADFQNASYSTTGETVFPFAFTDGSTNVKANSAGIVDLSSLNLGGSSYTAGTGIDITNDAISINSTVVALKSDIPTVPTNVSAFTNDAGYITNSVNNLTNYTLTSALATVATSGSYADLTNKPTIPDAVSGTNDGTNWTSITIGSSTYGIPSGGGSGGSGYYLHKIKLDLNGTSGNILLIGQLITTSSTSILTISDLITQINNNYDISYTQSSSNYYEMLSFNGCYVYKSGSDIKKTKVNSIRSKDNYYLELCVSYYHIAGNQQSGYQPTNAGYFIQNITKSTTQSSYTSDAVIPL